MELDLHIHSNASDGSLSPCDVVARAARGGLDVIALADHDTVDGVEEAVRAGVDSRVHVIPAVELSVGTDVTDIHILGYYVDARNEALLAHANAAAHRREERLRIMLDRLARQGIELSFEEVQGVRAAAPGKGTVGRLHLARALVEAGHVEYTAEAFMHYIGNDHDAYVPLRLLTPVEAIRLIGEAGGIAVWAHPPRRYLRKLIGGLVGCGLRGLEIYRPRTPPHQVIELERVAQAWGLLVTGGSDWHGPQHGKLGDFSVPATDITAFLDVGGI